MYIRDIIYSIMKRLKKMIKIIDFIVLYLLWWKYVLCSSFSNKTLKSDLKSDRKRIREVMFLALELNLIS